jgi:hypothetical protein
MFYHKQTVSKKIFIHTLGCQMNVRNSEVICGFLKKKVIMNNLPYDVLQFFSFPLSVICDRITIDMLS